MYADMTDFLKDRKEGDFQICTFQIREDDFRAIYRDGVPIGKYVGLFHKGACVMSNTPMEKHTNSNFCCFAHGDVLVGGLGIGMILLAIQDKEEVKHITVIEKYKEVIDLVKDQLPLNQKVEIINADVFDYVPNRKYNTIYIDIWNFINSDVYEEEMKPLMQRYRKYLVSKKEDSERFIDCWCRNNAKYDRPLI